MPWWLYDIVIFFFLLSVGVYIIHACFALGSSQRSLRKSMILTTLSFLWLVIFYGSLVEPHRLVVREQTIQLAEVSTRSIRVALISDVHVGPYKKQAWVRRVVDKINEQHPDLVLIAGDFIAHDPDHAEYLEPLRELKADQGVFAVTGNHDYIGKAPALIIQTLQGLGITVLENAYQHFDVDGERLTLAGMSDIWFEGDPVSTLYDLQNHEGVLVLLTHNPDAVLLPLAHEADLVLAGHTHGGQIRLPWIGSVPRVPTELGNAYDKGLFWYGDQPLFITSGVSETGSRARLFNPPEIALVTIEF